MERRGWLVLSAMAVTGVLVTPNAASAQGHDGDRNSMATITVRVDDKAGVQGALLKLAETRAAEVFAMSGVHIEWVDGRDAMRLKLSVPYMVLIMAEAPRSLRANLQATDVMGQGVPLVRRAYVYYDRVVAFRPIPPRDVPTTLGDVIAHELGHLVLPPGHSNVGIMRPTIEMRSRRVETFTESEASQIQSTLRERTRTANTEPRTSNAEPNMNVNTN